MINRFLQFIAKEKLFSPRDNILLAVSGGVDSVVMTDLFRKAGFTFGIVHCNFGLRGMDSDGDEFFVRELAASAESAFYSRYFDTAGHAEAQGISIQMAARELRFAFFREIAKEKGYASIAAAHHRDDSVETFLINLVRGTGLAGLKGIKPKGDGIIHPLLFASRDEIEAFALAHKLKFRHDASNDEDKYLRNQIRHHVVPAFLKAEPSFMQVMAENMQRFGQYTDLVHKHMQAVEEELVRHEKQGIIINFEKLLQKQAPALYLHHLLSPYGFSQDVVERLSSGPAIQSGKFFDSPTHRLLVNRGTFIIRPIEQDEEPAGRLIREGTRQINKPLHLRFTYQKRNQDFVIPRDEKTACFDADRLLFPLELRKWKKGDVFHPLGARGKKKLSDFFTDHKFSRFEKQNTWLLCSGEEIVWVVGRRTGQKARVTGLTKNLCIITIYKTST